MLPDRHLTLPYRPEIDGLRAVAVLSVILFHAGFSTLEGGFVGVDIFYVISGFLITRIVVDGLSKGSFSFQTFYARRVKRLLPAALLCLLVTVGFGYLILTPDKYVDLANSAIYAAFFLANLWFANNSGYFDQSAEISPLVHYWSLAVEEQFYLLFPFLIFALHRLWGFGGVRAGVAAMVVVSLGISVVLSPVYPNFSFYLMPTRAWELGVGALLVFLPWKHLDRSVIVSGLFFFGVFALVYAIFFVSRDNPYPGWIAMLPVFGTASIIVSCHSEACAGRRLFASRPMVFLGRISYSAYLWHWPIIAYYRVFVSERGFTTTETWFLVIVSLAVGYASWRLVEERFRYRQLPPIRAVGIGAVATVLVACAPAAVHFVDGFPSRISVKAASITDSRLMWEWPCPDHMQPFPDSADTYCVVGEKWDASRVKGVVWGDSHSLQFAPLLDRIGKARGISLLIAPLECPPYLNGEFVQEAYAKFPHFTQDCTAKHRAMVAWLNRHPEVKLIVMTAAWSGHIRQLYNRQFPNNATPGIALAEKSSQIGAKLSLFALRQTLDRIDLHDRHVLLLGDVPRPNRNLNDCAFNELGDLLRAGCERPYAFLDSRRVREWHADSDRVLSELARNDSRVTAIIPSNLMCGETRCPTSLDGELLYKDGNHLRRNLRGRTMDDLAAKLGLTGYFDAF